VKIFHLNEYLRDRSYQVAFHDPETRKIVFSCRLLEVVRLSRRRLQLKIEHPEHGPQKLLQALPGKNFWGMLVSDQKGRLVIAKSKEWHTLTGASLEHLSRS